VQPANEAACFMCICEWSPLCRR